MKKKTYAPSALWVVGSLLAVLCLGLSSAGCSDSDRKVYPPPPAPVDPAVTGFTSSHVLLLEGDTATITVASTDGVSASVDNGVGAVPLNGTFQITPAVDTTYTLTVTGAGGTSPAVTNLLQDVDRKPVITAQPVANPISVVAGSGTNVDVTIDASDPEGAPLIIAVIQSGTLTPATTVTWAAGTYTISFTAPATTGTVIIGANFDDGNGNSHDVPSDTVTVNVTVAPPAPPVFGAWVNDGLLTFNGVNNQKRWIAVDLTGYTADMISVTNGEVLRQHGTSSLLVVVPRQATLGVYNVEFTFNNGASSVNVPLTYTEVTTANFNAVWNYEKTGTLGRLIQTTMVNSVLGAVTETRAGTLTTNNIALAPGETESLFWVLYADGAAVKVDYWNRATNSSVLPFGPVTLSASAAPLSLASLRGGKDVAALWVAAGNPLTLTVVEDTGLPRTPITLDTIGKEVQLIDGVTKVMTVFRKRNGALPAQDEAIVMTGLNGTNLGVAVVMLASETYDWATANVTIRADQLVISSDPQFKKIRLTAVGNDGAGNISYQGALLDPAIGMPSFGAEVDLVVSANRVTLAADGYDSTDQQVLVFVEDGSNVYNFFNNSTSQMVTTGFAGMLVRDLVQTEGNAWLSVAANDANASKVRIIGSPDDVDFPGNTVNNVLEVDLVDPTNVLASTPTHVLAEIRDSGGANNEVVAIELTAATTQSMSAPALNAPTGTPIGDAGAASFRQATQDVK